VCIGARAVCDFYSTDPQFTLVADSWVNALSSAARANMSVYVVGAAGVEGRFDLGGGLVENTGGTDFVKSNNFERAAALIWDEAGHYYLLGYTPTSRSRKLHSIEVTTKYKGVHVRSRLYRGD
jgi:hypothetical protein